jgi:hypothetical protein
MNKQLLEKELSLTASPGTPWVPLPHCKGATVRASKKNSTPPELELIMRRLVWQYYPKEMVALRDDGARRAHYVETHQCVLLPRLAQIAALLREKFGLFVPEASLLDHPVMKLCENTFGMPLLAHSGGALTFQAVEFVAFCECWCAPHTNIII